MIHYDPKQKTFTLHTKNSTYQIQIDRYNYLLHLYYGKRMAGCADYLLTYSDRGFSPSPYASKNDRTYSLDSLPLEYPVQGVGDFRSPLLIIRDEKGTYGCDLRYESHEIIRGKYSLHGLPAVYADEEAETLKIFLKDERLGVRVTLIYGVLPEIDIITRSVELENLGAGVITLEKFGSVCLDFVHGEFDLITFYGRHMMERQFDRQKLHHGLTSIQSRRGMSSHQYNPFMILADKYTSEEAGRCWAMQFVYSGGFLGEAELSQYDQTRLQMGLGTEKFSYPLKTGETLTAPEVIMTFSNEGLAKLSHNLHACIKNHVCRYKGERPVLINSWEAAYFDFTGESILELAKEAHELGIEMLVLDDGWFGQRSNDNKALGDWTPNEEKLGGTLEELITKINATGLKFGLWVEPEMVSEDSELYRLHPDWAFCVPGKAPVLGRNQLVLDLSRKDVREYIYASMCKLLDAHNIAYIKWDYNRSIADVYSYVADFQGRVLYDYMLGLYDVLGKLTTRYPELLIEGCAGGGGRFDAGMLYYTPQIWCSDNTDAIDRLYIHYGTSFGYPASTIGAHVSSCPNQQTGRSVSLKTRYISAMTGAFGYELNLKNLTHAEKDEIKNQISLYKRDSELINNGLYYRLSNPCNEDYCAWEYISEDGKFLLINAVILANHGNRAIIYITPRGLTPGAFYREHESGKIYASDALSDSGLPLELPYEDFKGYSLHFERL